MTTTAVASPPKPADIERAALDLLVRAPELATGRTELREVLQDLAGALQLAGALAGLSWDDARMVVASIAFDAVMVDDPVGSLRHRANAVEDGWWGSGFLDDQAGVAHAIRTAADVIEML